MKRNPMYIIIALSIFSVLTSCNNNQTITPNSNNESIKLSSDKSLPPTESTNDTLKISTLSDWAKASKNLSDLFNDSDLVTLGKIKSAYYFCGNGALIYTRFTVEVSEIYKGSYDGGYIISMGGIVDYDEYLKHDVDPNGKKDFVNISPVKPKKVQLSFSGIPIVKPNDEYVIFSKDIAGKRSVTNGFEGLFKIDSNKISNKALKDNQALSNDIETRVSKRQNKNSTSKAVLNSSITTGLDKDLFISELEQLKDKN
ncbi:hypothetical protein [Clostridium manihotivorum]|uniref:Lipoprotein n=1 Tax=Clostridium manihotivorum TaxID=2320868 RepID=A0A3R5QYA1_9CLOT|nr:hypothetical protein [Clostridium manihotivorum]QAA35059.1 hypothetical protein C1I91_27340 [Clostridium manihotivorum]